MLLSFRLLSKLQIGTVAYIPLSDNYRLEMDEYKQFYISRGGKKKYHLSKRFLKRHLCEKESLTEERLVDLLLKVEEELIDLNSIIRKDSKAHVGIASILELIHDVYHSGDMENETCI